MASSARRRIGQVRPKVSIAPQLPVQAVGTSLYLPDRIVTNKDLAAELGCDDDWIVQRTGIRQRRVAAADQATSDLSIGAGAACLKAAGVAPEDVDLVVVATCTPDHLTPSTSCIVQNGLGCHRAAAFDVNAACSGFIYGYITAAQYVASGSYKNVLVIAADLMTRMMDPNDRTTYPLFGDGAGAMLLQPAQGVSVLGTDGRSVPVATDTASGILGFELGADGGMGDSLLFPAGGTRQPITKDVLDNGDQFLRMNGRAVFKWAVRIVPEIVTRLLARCNFPLEDVSMFVLHQANTRILDAAVSGLGISEDRVWSNVSKFGNTCAASVPLVLAEAEQAGKIKRGDHVVMCGFGAGLTWGSALVRW